MTWWWPGWISGTESFLEAAYERANLPSLSLDKRTIVSRCVKRFVINGYEDMESIVAACEDINPDRDDLNLAKADVPYNLVDSIYQTILGMRKRAPPQVCNTQNSQFYIRIWTIPCNKLSSSGRGIMTYDRASDDLNPTAAYMPALPQVGNTL